MRAKRGRPTGPPSRGSEGIDDADVQHLLRLAFSGQRAIREARGTQRAAAQAALRLVRGLEPRAEAIGGVLGRALARQPNDDATLEAVLAERLPAFAERVRALMDGPQDAPNPSVRPRRLAELTGDGASSARAAFDLDEPLDDLTEDDGEETTAVLAPPTDVVAEPGLSSATVRWTPPESLVDPLSHYLVTPFVDEAPQTPTEVSAAAQEATVIGLTPGTAYRFTVTAVSTTGAEATSVLSNEIVPFALPDDEEQVELRLPPFSSDPLLVLDPAAERARALLTAASQTGAMWRYEYLRSQAVSAAERTLGFEQQIAQVMAMAVDKLDVSQQLLGDTLRAALDELEQAKGTLGAIAEAPTIDELIGRLGDVAAEALLLPRFLDWLAEHSPIRFWVGLFEAVIRDLAAVTPLVGGPTNFARTKAHLDEAFSSDVGGVAAGLQEAAAAMLERLDADVAEMIAPLKAAVTDVVAETQQAMAEVFEAADITLLQTPPKTADGANVADLDPFQDLYGELLAQVDELGEQIKQRIREAVEPLTGGDPALFKTLVITYLVIPILAFLVISLAGGPVSAGLLAAAVLLAAEELVHLLLGWLTGPLRDQVAGAREQLSAIVAELQGFFAEQVGFVNRQSPERLLDILARQLRQVSDFVPQDFLEQTAAVLEQARAVVLRSASQLGLAAEQALGREHGTAFDALALDYRTDLRPAPQLPGGRDPQRLAGAALLADLDRLEQQRTTLRTGKDLTFTHRISLARLLGDDPAELARFLETGEVIVDLDERELLDRAFPGVHRALIQHVEVSGVLADPLADLGQLPGMPLTLTHLGESRTRIKPDANPHAPPVSAPDCLPDSVEVFVEAVVGDPRLTNELLAILETVDLQPINIYFLIFLVAAISGHEDPMEATTAAFKAACREYLPAAMGRLVEEASCGYADRSVIEEGTRRLIDAARFADALGDVLIPPDHQDRPEDTPDLAAGAAALAELLRDDVVLESPIDWPDEIIWRPGAAAAPAPIPPVIAEIVPGLERLARQSYDSALAAVHPHIAKWADATLEEDPDPQVRALGYKTLVRRQPSETVVFNLSADGAGTTARAEPLRPQVPAPPADTRSLQQRPLQNRGLGGRVLLRLEQVGDGTDTDPLRDALVDLLLDVTLRACFDPDLAQTVRASRQHELTARSVVDGLAESVTVPLPGELDEVEVGASELRRVHFGLRAHRDKTLRAWTAAAQAAPETAAELAAALEGKTTLSRDAAFEPLAEMSELTLRFVDAPPAHSVDWLQSLVETVPVSPADLGLAPAVLTDRDVREHARLESVGIAVIPMPGAEIDLDDAAPASDVLGVELQATPPLDALLPGFSNPAPLPERLMIADPVAAPPRLTDLFAAGEIAPRLQLRFDSGALASGQLYDVIVSLSFRVPVAEVSASAAALA